MGWLQQQHRAFLSPHGLSSLLWTVKLFGPWVELDECLVINSQMDIFKLAVGTSGSKACTNVCCFCFANSSSHFKTINNILLWLYIIASWRFSRTSVTFVCFVHSMSGCSRNADDSANGHSAMIKRRCGVQKSRAAVSCLAQPCGQYPFGQRLQPKEPKLYLNSPVLGLQCIC